MISRNINDGSEVTVFKITNITGGTLFKNDGITVISGVQPVFFADANAGLKFTPTANSTSNGSFDVQAGMMVPGTGLVLSSGSATATITVIAQDDPPTVANPIANVTVLEDAADSTIDLSTVFDDIDSSNAAITKAVLSNTNNTLVNASVSGDTLTLAYQPDQFGTATIVIRGTSNGLTVDDSFDVTVTAVNDQPAFSAGASTTAVEGSLYSYAVQVADPDDAFGAGLSIMLTGTPTGMVLDSATGIITWTPGNGVTTSGPLVLTVSDGGEDGAVPITQNFTISVSATNDPPVFDAQTVDATATEDMPYSYPLQVTDIDDTNNGSDLFFTLTNAPSGMTVSNTGVISWTPLEGVPTSGTVTVTVEDGNEDGSTPTLANNGQINFSITVTPVNDSPTITSTASTSAIEGVQYSYQVTEGDPDDTGFGANASVGGGLTIALSNAPAGMVVDPDTGLITWTPGNGVLTSGMVTVTVTDGGEDGSVPAVQTFTVSVTAVNTPPSFNAQTVTSTATEDVAYSYALQVTDLDDVNNGIDLSFTLSNAPTGMTVSNTGVISWTPLEGVLTSGTVTATVEDGNEDATTPSLANNGQIDFNITVAPVNDAPVITSTPPDTTLVLTEQVPVTVYQLAQTDVDDVNFTYSLGGSGLAGDTPAGDMAIDSNGVITWTPPRTGLINQPTAIVTVTVSDVDSSTAGANILSDMQQFQVSTTAIDTDNDGIADYADNCPLIDNADQSDNDNDTQYVANAGFPAVGDVDTSDPSTGGDACDSDDDNDGIADVDENKFDFLDPFDASDAASDQDNDGLTNLEEILAGTDPGSDSAGPVVTPPDNLNIAATGYLTTVDIGQATAVDAIEGSIAAVYAALDVTDANRPGECSDLAAFISKPDTMTPGKHIVTWAACDSLGNLSLATQTVIVRPIVSVARSSVSGEGRSVSIAVELNGEAGSYPVSVDYTVSGTAGSADYSKLANKGTVSFATAGESVSINFDVLNDSVSESDETVILTLSNPVNAVLGNANQHTLTITDENVAPQVSWAASQGAQSRASVLYQTDGVATVMAKASDANGDALSFDWRDSDSALLALATISGDTISFDPAALSAGLYPLAVKVSDGKLVTVIERLFSIKAGVAVTLIAGKDSDGDGVNDDVEGLNDSDADGIPDYLDNSATPANVIENQTGDLSHAQLVETEPGLTISLGSTAVAAGATGIQVSPQNVADFGGTRGGAVTNAGTDYAFISGLFSFDIAGLAPNMQSVDIVLPLPTVIQSGAVYRKYIAATGWADFVEDDLNHISSARGENGICPGPGSSEYTDGLTVLDNCIQLTIQDGGANDADGLRNFIIMDPGGLALVPEDSESSIGVTNASSSSNGRLGAMNGQFLLLMLLMTGIAYRLRR